MQQLTDQLEELKAGAPKFVQYVPKNDKSESGLREAVLGLREELIKLQKENEQLKQELEQLKAENAKASPLPQ